MHAALVSHYLGGAFYPVGGASVLAEGIAPLIEAHGGHLAVSAEVSDIVIEQGIAVGVRLADGSEQRAPLVISDAGVANTFGRLVPEANRPASWTKALATVPPSSSYLCLYLGFKATDAELGLTGTNLWLYPDEKHDENVARFEADPEAPFPMVYLSFPSAKDPDFQRRFPGRATVDVITMAKWEWFSKWQGTKWHKRGEDYDAFKQRFTERLLEVVFKRLPQLRGRVDVAELSTPLTAEHFASHPRGELYGIDHTPARYELPLRAKTPIPGLMLTGADLATCGVAGGALEVWVRPNPQASTLAEVRRMAGKALREVLLTADEFEHCLTLASEYLYAHGAFVVVDIELLHALVGIPDESLGGYKLGIHEVGSVAVTNSTERGVAHVLHWGKEQGKFAQFERANTYHRNKKRVNLPKIWSYFEYAPPRATSCGAVVPPNRALCGLGFNGHGPSILPGAGLNGIFSGCHGP
jgi:hypothetical protein